MSNNKKRSITAVLIIVAAVATITIMRTKNTDDKSLSASQTNVKQATNAQSIAANGPSTIASQWLWQETNKQAKQANSSTEINNDEPLPFTPQSVYDALQAVKVDENGDIIRDHGALISLDEALERIHNRLNSDSLFSLQDLIKGALPGKVGEQTAELVEDYYGFLEAKEEFSQIHEGLANASAQQSAASLNSDQALYGELQVLRAIHLGRQATDSLFRVSDANAQFMFDSMQLGFENSLSPEEIATRRAEIQTRHQEQLGELDNNAN